VIHYKVLEDLEKRWEGEGENQGDHNHYTMNLEERRRRGYYSGKSKGEHPKYICELPQRGSHQES
jgi:hypothetical protein